MEEETLVLGGKDGIDEHFRNLLEMNEAASLALFACEIVHELRLKTIPGRFFIAIHQDNVADMPIPEQDTGGLGAKK